MKKRKIAVYAFPVLLLLVTAGLYIFKEYNRTHKDTAKLKPDYSIKAAELINDFAANESIAGKKYWDRVILVKGNIKDINKDERGLYAIALGDTSSMSSVRCTIDSLHSNEVSNLQIGMPIAIKGICSGFNADELLGSDVVLVRCVVDQVK